MRIIAGALGGRTLRAPRGQDTRPTGERVREALFNILGPPPEGARVLDLFAGAGALGLEALSRGAASCVFVERAAAALAVIQANIDSLGLTDHAQILRIPVAAAITRLDGKAPPFDWIFVDPPYATDDAKQILAAIDCATILAPGGTLIIEHDRRRPPDGATPGKTLALADRRRYGDTELSFYRHREALQETT